jgi:hypothetical protein
VVPVGFCVDVAMGGGARAGAVRVTVCVSVDVQVTEQKARQKLANDQSASSQAVFEV